MALARVQYEADGSTTEYSITFEYIERDHIQVSLDGDETTAWSFLDDSTIKFDSAPADGVIIDIVRQTEREVLLVEFNDGSTLLETDLTLAALQSFYLAQESFDQTGSTLTVANDGSYSASGRRISQLEYPNSSDDATNRQYVDDVFADGENAADMALEAQHWANYPEDDLVPEGDGVDDYSALHHRNKADDAQAASELARDEAQLWAEEDEDVEVETGAYSSKHHSIKSSDSASAAATSEANAAASESNAATSASNASTSESNADSHATEAQNWANTEEDTLVPEGDQVDDYSALHWARKAEGWAQSLNMPSASGNAGRIIQQKDDESGFKYVDKPVSMAGPLNAVTHSASGSLDITLDVDSARHVEVDLQADVTDITVSTPYQSDSFILTLAQDSTGGHSVTWMSPALWPYGEELEVSAGANEKDVFQLFTVDGGTTWHINLVGADYS